MKTQAAAAIVGEVMIKANDFAKRVETSRLLLKNWLLHIDDDILRQFGLARQSGRCCARLARYMNLAQGGFPKCDKNLSVHVERMFKTLLMVAPSN